MESWLFWVQRLNEVHSLSTHGASARGKGLYKSIFCAVPSDSWQIWHCWKNLATPLTVAKNIWTLPVELFCPSQNGPPNLFPWISSISLYTLECNRCQKDKNPSCKSNLDVSFPSQQSFQASAKSSSAGESSFKQTNAGTDNGSTVKLCSLRLVH